MLALSQLGVLLGLGEYLELEDEFELVWSNETQEQLLVKMPDRLVHKLAQLEDSDIEAVLPEWTMIEEFKWIKRVPKSDDAPQPAQSGGFLSRLAARFNSPKCGEFEDIEMGADIDETRSYLRSVRDLLRSKAEPAYLHISV